MNFINVFRVICQKIHKIEFHSLFSERRKKHEAIASQLKSLRIKSSKSKYIFAFKQDLKP